MQGAELQEKQTLKSTLQLSWDTRARLSTATAFVADCPNSLYRLYRRATTHQTVVGYFDLDLAIG